MRQIELLHHASHQFRTSGPGPDLNETDPNRSYPLHGAICSTGLNPTFSHASRHNGAPFTDPCTCKTPSHIARQRPAARSVLDWFCVCRVGGTFAMSDEPDSPCSGRIPVSALILFLAITFTVTWGLIGIYIAFPEMAANTFGQISGSHPFFFLATWSPAIAAFTVVFLYSGTSGLGLFLSRLAQWRGSSGWAAFILLLLPLVFIAGSLIKGGPVLAPLPPEGASAVFAALFIMLFLGPIEEFGWRGVMQPLLQRHMAPIWAGLIIGATWGVWHLPAFFLAGVVFADWNFLPFFIGNVTLAVLVTPIFNSARGSLLWPMLFHWQLINPFWPDAQPWDTIILVSIAIIVVWYNRGTMFTREGAVTEVIPAVQALTPRASE